MYQIILNISKFQLIYSKKNINYIFFLKLHKFLHLELGKNPRIIIVLKFSFKNLIMK